MTPARDLIPAPGVRPSPLCIDAGAGRRRVELAVAARNRSPEVAVLRLVSTALVRLRGRWS